MAEERTRDVLRSLAEMFGYLTDPATDDRSRRAALAFFPVGVAAAVFPAGRA